MDAVRRFSLPLRYYGVLLRKVLSNRSLSSAFAVATAVYAVGHGTTALAAGLLGRALIANPGLLSPTFRFLSDPATLAFVGLLATTVKCAGATLSATAQSRLAQNVAADERRQLAGRLLERGSSLSPGHLSARVSVYVREVEFGVEGGVLGGARAALTLVPLAASLAVLSWKMAAGALFVLGPFAIGVAAARQVWRRSHLGALAMAERIEQELAELLGHIDLWRTFGAGEKVQQALDLAGRRGAELASRAEGMRAALSGANEVLGAAALLVCVLTARRFGLSLADGRLVAFAVVFFMAYRPLRDLGDARSALERGALALSVLDDLPAKFSSDSNQPPAQSPSGWAHRRLRVQALQVDRAAAPDGWILQAPAAVSFFAEPGEIVALAGPTGSGKTTLLRALLGLEPLRSGSILYGELELAHRGVGPTERPFGWVPQDAPVLAGSVEDNVTLGRRDEASVADALTVLGAPPLATAWAGERLGAVGRAVSGGERKWIALARAVASRAPVLLLDEPTAGLDANAKHRLIAAFRGLGQGRTLIVVSHDPEVLEAADRIVRIGDAHQNWASMRGSFSNKSRMSGMS